MTTVFLICATLGGGVLMIQFVMSLIGLGTHALDFDTPGHMDAGLHTDMGLGTDFHGANKPEVELGSGIAGNTIVPATLLESIEALRRRPDSPGR